MITFDRVSKVFDRSNVALKEVSFEIARGEFVFLVGQTGAGKSTLVRLLYRDFPPTKGSIMVDGREITRIPPRRVPLLRRKLGVVYQDFKLLPSKTVYQNVAFALVVTEAPRYIIKRRVPELLKMVGLEEKLDAYPHQLSGGEKQRVAMARALANSPKILVADEPTGNLDPETSWQVTQVLAEVNRRGTTVIMATHDRSVVNAMQKRVLTLREGRLIRDQERGIYVHEA